MDITISSMMLFDRKRWHFHFFLFNLKEISISGENPQGKTMTMPSDELHNVPPVSIADFSGISIQDALKFQKMIRARVALFGANPGMKSKAINVELKGLDVALSVYVSEEISKQEG